MRTRLFLRTAEFLWQEGHTAHATKDEATEEVLRMIEVYRKFAEEYMALPVIVGRKTETERFAGAIDTYCIEAMMQDGKALQSGTSHHLGQNFAKAFDCKFQTKEGELDYVWATSWGVSTRLIGALIMAHSDDKGLVLPPKLASKQVVIVPILKGDTSALLEKASALKAQLEAKNIATILDESTNNSPGWKFAEYELQGIPVRIEIGPRDLKNNQCVIARRDTSEKITIELNDSFASQIETLLSDIQNQLFEKAKALRHSKTWEVDTFDEFKTRIEEGFVIAHWDGTSETEAKIKEETKATIRAIPTDPKYIDMYALNQTGKCVYTGNPSSMKVVFAKAY